MPPPERGYPGMVRNTLTGTSRNVPLHAEERKAVLDHMEGKWNHDDIHRSDVLRPFAAQ